MAQSISKQPYSSKKQKLKARDRFFAESKVDSLINKSRQSSKKAHNYAHKQVKREQKRQLRDSNDIPGLKNIISPEALALTPGEGLLQFIKAKKKDIHEQVELECSSAEAKIEASPKLQNIANEEEFISLDIDDQTEMGKQFVEAETESNKYANEFPCPWIGNERQSGSNLSVGECLASEVLEFLRYVSPTKAEAKKRDECVARLRQAVKQLWPDATVSVFGSYATGIYLPNADIDVVILSKKMRSKVKGEMYRLSSKLKSNRIAKKISVIPHARVPIIKYVEAGTGINVDIAFSQSGGIETVHRVSGWLDSNQALKPLAMVIRQFLKRRDLSDVATGGLGGYATMCLVYSRLQQRSQEIKEAPLRNIGLLLLDFFDFYGHKFDNTAHYVRPQEHPKCYPLAKRLNGSMATPQASGLAIEDPMDKNNNISKATHNYPTIKRSFGNAADFLKSMCLGWQKLSPAQKSETSFLGPLLKFDGAQQTRSKQPLNQALSIVRLQQTPETKVEPKSHNNSVEKGRGVARFDHFRSSDAESERPESRQANHSLTAKRSEKRTYEARKRSRRDFEDEDSRIKLTVDQRRQFWNRKAGMPETASAN